MKSINNVYLTCPMKKIVNLLSILYLLTSCNHYQNPTLTKDVVNVFEGCTLLFRGYNDDGYGQYVVLVNSNNNISRTSLLHVLYKTDRCYKIFVHDDSVTYDTTQVLNILSTAEHYKITEIYSLKNHIFSICLGDKDQTFYLQIVGDSLTYINER